MRLLLSFFLFTLLVSVSTPGSAGEGYFRFPAHKGDRIFFVAEGDIWSAPLKGGGTQRLTTHPGQELRPVISPDGAWLAFTASYEGQGDVYVMPVEGGLPRRVGFEGGTAVGWTPDGDVIYVCSSNSGPSGQRVLVQVNPSTLKRAPLPLADANDACMDDSGKFLYFIRLGINMMNDNARNYRGGAMSELWRYEIGSNKEAVRLNVPCNVKRPMWQNNRLYFIGDSSGCDNIWSIEPDGSGLTQITNHTDWDIRYAYLSDGKISYQQGADIRILDLTNNQDSVIKAGLISDFDQMRKRSIKGMDYLNSVSFAPDGNRVVFTARGNIALASNQSLRRVDVAVPDGSRAMSATLSKDGKWVYAFNDRSGEKQIWRFPSDGKTGGEVLTSDKGIDRLDMYPSPDGAYIAHTDRGGNLWLLNLTTKENRLIDSNNYSSWPTVTWAGDSKTIAISRSNSDLRLTQILLYSLETKQKTQITSDKYQSWSPVFSPDGRWMYFLSDRHFQVGNSSVWATRDMGPYFDRKTKVYAIALSDGLRFPFQPDTELDGAATAAEPHPSAETKNTRNTNQADVSNPPAIQWDGLANRLFEVPLPPGNYQSLSVDAKRLYFIERDGRAASLKTLEINNNDPKAEVFSTDVSSYSLSMDAKKIMLARRVGQNTDYYILDAGAKAPQDISKFAVKVGDWNITVEPKAEWRQMFYDAWRMHRDRFYDSKLRGLDWVAIKAKYEPLLDRLTERNELNDLLAQMMGELGAMHSQVAPGEQRRLPDAWLQSHLGAILSKTPDGYRIDRIYRTEAELPDEAGPLAKPGMDVREGDIITNVNGHPVLEARDISDLLNNRAGQQVLLGLRRGQTDIKPVVVIPVNSMQNASLRYTDWEESNRVQVEKAGDGCLGYLHLRAMGGRDISSFAREFYANIGRDGLIIDVRRNNGGNIDSWIIEKLLRRAWAFWTTADGQYRGTNMQQTFRGHLVVLIDEYTYSDGETFAEGVKRLGLAPLVGRRTAGAGVWLTDSNRLLDGGMIRVAEWPQFATADGAWLIEGTGVVPDIEVVNYPLETFQGKDRQLERAIELLKEKIDKNPIPELKPERIPGI